MCFKSHQLWFSIICRLCDPAIEAFLATALNIRNVIEFATGLETSICCVTSRSMIMASCPDLQLMSE